MPDELGNGVNEPSVGPQLAAGSASDPEGPRSDEDVRSPRKAWRPRQRRVVAALLSCSVGIAMGWLVNREVRSSVLQSWLFSRLASRLEYDVRPGAASRIVFPRDGPLDRRRGYTRLAEFTDRLRRRGFAIREQAQFSPQLQAHVARGLDPPQWLPARSGLVVSGSAGETLYGPVARTFRTGAEVPDLVRRALLFIEDRQLSDLDEPMRNPAVNWGRFGRAAVLFAAGKVGLPVSTEGGSTLVTQMEKFRHSPQGRTDSLAEKMRQVFDASLKAYRDGRDTREERREIVAHYLNSMPLSAAPGYGEVHGLGQGLWAWFGLELHDVVKALDLDGAAPARAHAFKHVLALLCAVREPSRLLLADRAALEKRADAYAWLMAREGLLDAGLARAVVKRDLRFDYRAPAERRRVQGIDKAVDAVRRALLADLGVASLYQLDRLDLKVATPIDVRLAKRVNGLLHRLDDPAFIREAGLAEERLLAHGDPSKVLYSVLLFEKTSRGNLLRVQADSLESGFDLNEEMKLELGSTAKLRTLAHYLGLVARLHGELAPLSADERRSRLASAADPLTRWAASALTESANTLPELLEAALDRTYSASPAETFFTGGGVHRFHNFSANDDDRFLSVREATARSVNLVYIRLMRDLVRHHEARLPYDVCAVLSQAADPVRRRLLERAAEEEDRVLLFRAWKRFREKGPQQILAGLLGTRSRSARHLAILYFAWHPSETANVEGLQAWLAAAGVRTRRGAAERLFHAYGNPRLTLSDHAYLLGRRPMDVFAAGRLRRERTLGWDELWASSAPARQVASAWLFKSSNRSAQQRRLRIQIERDAFAAMTLAWRRLGFPFDRLVPSLATSIGSSSDRPAALAELMGIIMADGLRLPAVRVRQLRFAERTPYHTVFARTPPAPERVMHPAVARALRGVLALVVEDGTARRVAGVFRDSDGRPISVGGKTGTGDNRVDTFAPTGELVSSKVVNRTATFVFYIGRRYFGVVTAFVDGAAARTHRFTSSLPLSVLKLLAPAMAPLVNEAVPARPAPTIGSLEGTS